jgi:hypothetical protein
LVDLIENNVGKDLQFLRFNGALIGGFAGLLIYSTEALFALRKLLFTSLRNVGQAGFNRLVESEGHLRTPRRNSRGVLPVQRRKAWRKFAGSLNPTAVAMSSLAMTVSRRYFTATWARSSSTNLR